MRIAFDLDDTLARTAEAVLAEINAALGTSATIAEMVSPKWEDIIPSVSFPLIKGIFEAGVFARLLPIEGAVEFVLSLVNEGHEVVVITDRFWNADDKQVTETWLANQGIQVPIHLCKSGAKAALCQELGIEVMFEDRTANAVAIAEVVQVSYLIDHPSNQRDEVPASVTRFSSYTSFTW